MPFFGENMYLSSANRVWIWVLLTVPSTAGAFLFYWWLTRRRGKRISKEMNAEAVATALPRSSSIAAAHSNTAPPASPASPTSPTSPTSPSSQVIPMQVIGQQIV